MKIRRAERDDLDVLVSLNGLVHELHVSAEPNNYRTAGTEERRAVLREWLEVPGKEIWIAEIQGRAAGYMIFKELHREETPFTFSRGWLYVDQVGVLPEHRGEGVGRALMRHAEERARELKLDKVTLHVRAANPEAMRFYEAIGYAAEQVGMARSVTAICDEIAENRGPSSTD
jgi:ribosomal protein S18 acetylase RimI-like enzyme